MNRNRTIAVVIIVLVLAATLFTFTACDDTPVVETRFAFNFDEISVWGISGILMQGFFNNEKSGITLRSDGTMTMDIIVSDDLGVMLLSLKDTAEELLAGLDMAYMTQIYLEPIMPGFTFDDIHGSLAQAKEALGVSFVSDGDTSAFIDVLAQVLVSGKLPDDLTIPAGFGIRLESTYYVKDVVYPDGTVYKGVYLTPTDPDTQPYVVFDMSEKEDGGYRLNLKIDFINLNLTADEVLPEVEGEESAAK